MVAFRRTTSESLLHSMDTGSKEEALEAVAKMQKHLDSGGSPPWSMSREKILERMATVKKFYEEGDLTWSSEQ